LGGVLDGSALEVEEEPGEVGVGCAFLEDVVMVFDGADRGVCGAATELPLVFDRYGFEAGA
jgi:hypothetical protein